jgi:pantothenate kinase
MPSTQPILSSHRIIIIEGLYTLLDRPGWDECARVMDLRIWIEVERAVARKRLIGRNFEVAIVDDLERCTYRGRSTGIIRICAS